jgi:aminoglycoside phosphotransferase (APT) family kinase protein
MRFIKACTSIPLPAVFAWETSEGVAGAPFASMSFVEGSQLLDRWFDKSWTTEEKRREILSGNATLVSELGKFPFDALGALEFDRDGLASGYI